MKAEDNKVPVLGKDEECDKNGKRQIDTYKKR